ncbi:hypothetical protein GCM10010492_54500 [Saccharothrix mutabilis subsp. mutabilis]|uniref:HPt domain-containing protein n=1 Tax=Saccharothrix mutabilis subsp. mutabilis TaxID=66855 RepID=A0ABN0UEF2_9PSEU
MPFARGDRDCRDPADDGGAPGRARVATTLGAPPPADPSRRAGRAGSLPEPAPPPADPSRRAGRAGSPPERRTPAAVPPEFRLRYIAMRAAEFTAILDDLHRRYAELETDTALGLRAVVEQAAAAAHDLAVSAHRAADALSGGGGP